MKRLMLCLFVLAVVMSASSAFALELLGNPSFANPSGWQGTTWGSPGTFLTTGIPAGAPSAHCYFATPGPTNARTCVATDQTLGQILGQGAIFHVSAWFYVSAADLAATGATEARAYVRYNANPGDAGYMLMDPFTQQVYDSSGTLVPTNVVIPTDTWTKKEFDCKLPGGSTLNYFVLGVYGFADHTTTAATTPAPKAYFDDASLTANYGTLSGTVTDTSNQPIAGATVTLTAGANALGTATTDATGAYTFASQLPYGTYTVTASKVTYYDNSATASVDAASTTIPAIVLDRADVVSVSGQVFEMVGGVKQGVAGVTVNAKYGTWVVSSAPSDSNGNYTLQLIVGQWDLTAAPIPVGKKILATPGTISIESLDAQTGKDIEIGPNPDYDPDMYFNLRSSDLTAGGPWPTVNPVGGSLTVMGTPSVATIGATQWEANKADGDGYHFANIPIGSSLAFNGGTIVVVAKPVRVATGNAYQHIVSVLLNQMTIGIQRDTGQLRVRRGGSGDITGPNILDSKKVVLSFVVQPTGEFKVYSNGVEVMNNTTTANMTTLAPTVSYGTDVNVGRAWNGDGWSSFNGNIGDVYVYKTALSDAKRTALEASLMTKFDVQPDVTITVSPGANGTISPATGPVASGSNPVYTITPNVGYKIKDVLVGTTSVLSELVNNTYTFTNVTSDKTISATFEALPPVNVSGKVTNAATGAGIPGARVYFALTANPSAAPIFTAIASSTPGSEGTYTQSLPPGNWYLAARATGFNTSADLSVTTSTTDLVGKDFALTTRTTSLIMELNPWDYDPITKKWSFTQGSLAPEYFQAAGTPKYTRNAAGTRYSAIQQGVGGGDGNTGFGGPLVPASILGNNPRTIEAWTYNPSCTSYEALVELAYYNANTGHNMYDGGNFSLSNGNLQGICGYKANDTDASNQKWTATAAARGGKWVHLVVTYDDTTAKLYINGALDSSKVYTYNTAAGSSLVIGSLRTTFSGAHATGEMYAGNYTGYIGQVRLYDNALTATEVANRYALGVNGGEALATMYNISGTVTDTATGLPLAGAQVYVSKISPATASGQEYVLTTGADGKYTASVAQGATYYVSAMKSRYAPNPAPEQTLTNLQKDEVANFALTPDATLTKLVDLDASTLTVGTNLAAWPNAGTLGGSFVKNNTTGPNVVANIAGKQAVQFINASSNAIDRRTLVLKNTSNVVIPTPSSIAGNSDWTISTVLYRSSTELAGNGPENTYMCWAGRDWSTPMCAQFRYSIPGDAGAYSHGNLTPTLRVGFATTPTAGAWHVVTITYDGNSEKIYVDGRLDRTDANILNIRPGGLMMLGGANWQDGATQDQYWGYNGAIASLKIYDQALTADEVASQAGLVKISGRVLCNGNPIAGAKVDVASDPGAAPFSSVTTNALGQYAVYVAASPASGFYYLYGSATAYANAGPLEVAVAAANVTQDITLAAAPKVSGIVKDSVSGQPVANAVLQLTSNGVAAPAIVTDATGAYSCNLALGINQIYADALGYADRNVDYNGVDETFGQQTIDIALTPKVETSVIVNGNFEQANTDGTPAGWQIGVGFNAVCDNTTNTTPGGSKSALVTPKADMLAGNAGRDWAAFYQDVPVISGNTYNFYFKGKGAGTSQLFHKLDILDANKASINGLGWVGPTGWVYAPYANWTQIVTGIKDGAAAAAPMVRIALPDTAKFIRCFFSWPANNTLTAADMQWVDDVVIDRVGPDTPPVTEVANLTALKAKAGTGETVKLTGAVTVTCKNSGVFFVGEESYKGCIKVVGNDAVTAGSFVKDLTGIVTVDGNGQYTITLSAPVAAATGGNAIKVVGANNKAAKTDAKLRTNVVKVWGKVVNSTIDDGYGSPITVINPALGTGTVSVTGVLWQEGGSVVLYQNL